VLAVSVFRSVPHRVATDAARGTGVDIASILAE
jgi:hypothetical protein